MVKHLDSGARLPASDSILAPTLVLDMKRKDCGLVCIKNSEELHLVRACSIRRVLTKHEGQSTATPEDQPKGLGLYSEDQTQCCNPLMLKVICYP